MKTFRVFITIPLNPKINDPQGNTIASALVSLGFITVESVRAGRTLVFQVQAESEEEVRSRLRELVKHPHNPLKINPTLETWEAEITEVENAAHSV